MTWIAGVVFLLAAVCGQSWKSLPVSRAAEEANWETHFQLEVKLEGEKYFFDVWGGKRGDKIAVSALGPKERATYVFWQVGQETKVEGSCEPFSVLQTAGLARPGLPESIHERLRSLVCPAEPPPF